MDGQLVVSNLTKVYPKVRAVDNLSFTVQPGRVTGFLGPNGSGKTTTLRMMLNLVTPTAGTATIGGVRYADLPRPLDVVGAVLEASSAHKGRTGRNHLRVLCAAAGYPDRRADEVLDLVGLTPAANRKFRGYSLGMRQRLGIAAAMIGDPKVLILDEPASDLDPRARIEIRDLLVELRSLGKTIFLSSHILTELSDVCTSVAILEKGHLVVYGPIAEISQRLAYARNVQPPPPSPEAQVVTPSQAPQAPAAPQRKLKIRILGHAQAAAPYLQGGPGIVSVEAQGEWLLVGYVGDDSLVAAMVRHLVMNGVPVIGVEPERNELERIFLEVTRGELQ